MVRARVIFFSAAWARFVTRFPPKEKNKTKTRANLLMRDTQPPKLKGLKRFSFVLVELSNRKMVSVLAKKPINKTHFQPRLKK